MNEASWEKTFQRANERIRPPRHPELPLAWAVPLLKDRGQVGRNRASPGARRFYDKQSAREGTVNLMRLACGLIV